MIRSQKITKAFVDQLQASDKDAIYPDSELKGFSVKVTPKGRKVFIVLHRPKNSTGNRKLYTIGPYGRFSVQQARDKALEILTASRNGVDLHEQEKAEVRKREEGIVNDLVDQFLAKHASQTRTAKETERILKHDVLPEIGKRSIHTITKHDIISIIESIQKRGSPIMANRTLAIVRKFFNWCVSRAVIDVSPVQGAKAVAKEPARERVLTPGEVRNVLLAAINTLYPFGPFIQLLFYTGQRRDEVASMQWSELDLERKLWTIPGIRAKNGKSHDVHLCDAAVELLKKQPRFAREDGTESDYVFTTTGRTSISGFSKAKAQLDKLSGVDNWRLHDIRRTVATGMSKLGTPIHVVEALLNHKSGTVSGIVAVYQKNEFEAERKEAMKKWCERLSGIVSDKPVPVLSDWS